MVKKKTPTIYSGSAPKNGNDLRPLSAIINIESQSPDQRTRVLEFQQLSENYNKTMDNRTICSLSRYSGKRFQDQKSPLLELFHAYL